MTQASPLVSAAPALVGSVQGPEATAVIKHVAHELRQPLSTIESIAFFLEMVLPQTETKALEQIAKLQDLVEQANAVLGDAIHYLQAAPSKPVALDLNAIVTRCHDEDFYYHQSFVLDLAVSLPLVHADSLQMDHMVRTLFSLMLRSCNSSSRKTFQTFSDGLEVRLTVSCPSMSMTENAMRTFSSPLHPHSVGCGLSFASVQRIAHVHNGRVVVHSDGETFSVQITFPAV